MVLLNRQKTSKIEEYKRIIVIPSDNEIIGQECCIKRRKTTDLELLRQCREEYNIFVSDDVLTKVSLIDEGVDSLLQCLAASGYAIVLSLIFESSESNNQIETSSWAYLPTKLGENQKKRLKNILLNQNCTSIDIVYFVSLKDGMAKSEIGEEQKKLSITSFFEMLDGVNCKRKVKRPNN